MAELTWGLVGSIKTSSVFHSGTECSHRFALTWPSTASMSRYTLHVTYHSNVLVITTRKHAHAHAHAHARTEQPAASESDVPIKPTRL